MRPLPPRHPRLRHLGMCGALSLLVLAAGCSDDKSSDEGAAADETTTALGVVYTSCADIPAAGTGGALNEGAVVDMIDFEFCEPDITIEAGQTVEFVNDGAARHQVLHDPPGDQEREFKAPSAMLPGDSYTYVFDTPGVYPYICSFHSEDGMVGQITVE